MKTAIVTLATILSTAAANGPFDFLPHLFGNNYGYQYQYPQYYYPQYQQQQPYYYPQYQYPQYQQQGQQVQASPYGYAPQYYPYGAEPNQQAQATEYATPQAAAVKPTSAAN